VDHGGGDVPEPAADDAGCLRDRAESILWQGRRRHLPDRHHGVRARAHPGVSARQGTESAQYVHVVNPVQGRQCVLPVHHDALLPGCAG